MMVMLPSPLTGALFSSLVTSSIGCFRLNVNRIVLQSEMKKEAIASQSELLMPFSDLMAARTSDIGRQASVSQSRDLEDGGKEKERFLRPSQ